MLYTLFNVLLLLFTQANSIQYKELPYNFCPNFWREIFSKRASFSFHRILYKRNSQIFRGHLDDEKLTSACSSLGGERRIGGASCRWRGCQFLLLFGVTGENAEDKDTFFLHCESKNKSLVAFPCFCSPSFPVAVACLV